MTAELEKLKQPSPDSHTEQVSQVMSGGRLIATYIKCLPCCQSMLHHASAAHVSILLSHGMQVALIIAAGTERTCYVQPSSKRQRRSGNSSPEMEQSAENGPCHSKPGPSDAPSDVHSVPFSNAAWLAQQTPWEVSLWFGLSATCILAMLLSAIHTARRNILSHEFQDAQSMPEALVYCA